MPIYEVTAPDGTQFELEGDQPPTAGQLKKIYALSMRKLAEMPVITQEKKPEALLNPVQPTANDATGFGSYDINKEVPGTSGGPDLVSQVLPRTTAARGRGAPMQQEFGSYAMDVASLPGRAIASIPAGLGGGEEAYLESLAKPEGDNIIGDIVRSPASAAMAASGGLGLLPAAAIGALTTQLDKGAQEQPTSGAQAMLETAGTVAGGKAGEKLIGAVTKPILGLAKAEKDAFAQKLFQEAKDKVAQADKMELLKKNIDADEFLKTTFQELIDAAEAKGSPDFMVQAVQKKIAEKYPELGTGILKRLAKKFIAPGLAQVAKLTAVGSAATAGAAPLVGREAASSLQEQFTP